MKISIKEGRTRGHACYKRRVFIVYEKVFTNIGNDK